MTTTDDKTADIRQWHTFVSDTEYSTVCARCGEGPSHSGHDAHAEIKLEEPTALSNVENDRDTLAAALMAISNMIDGVIEGGTAEESGRAIFTTAQKALKGASRGTFSPKEWRSAFARAYFEECQAGLTLERKEARAEAKRLWEELRCLLDDLPMIVDEEEDEPDDEEDEPSVHPRAAWLASVKEGETKIELDAQAGWLPHHSLALVGKAIYERVKHPSNGETWFSKGQGCMDGVALASYNAILIRVGPAPEPLQLACPKCNAPHVDQGEWATKPHRTHLCDNCAHLWRPKDTPTVGVRTHEHSPATEANDTQTCLCGATRSADWGSHGRRFDGWSAWREPAPTLKNTRLTSAHLST